MPSVCVSAGGKKATSVGSPTTSGSLATTIKWSALSSRRRVSPSFPSSPDYSSSNKYSSSRSLGKGQQGRNYCPFKAALGPGQESCSPCRCSRTVGLPPQVFLTVPHALNHIGHTAGRRDPTEPGNAEVSPGEILQIHQSPQLCLIILIAT